MTIADHPPVRETFSTSRLLDFFSEKELTGQIGHGRDDWPLVALKELADNALDACEEVGIAPRLSVALGTDHITLSDNGPGIAPETVASILDYTTRTSSREAYVEPTRGAQGNALKTLVAMPFVLDGEHGRVVVEARGVRHEITVRVDQIRQEPVIDHQQTDIEARDGTTVRLDWPEKACLIVEDASDRFLQVAEDYAWLNPHMALSVEAAGERRDYEPTDASWAKWSPSTLPVAHWYTAEDLARLIAACIHKDEQAAAHGVAPDLDRLLVVLVIEDGVTAFVGDDELDNRITIRSMRLIRGRLAEAERPDRMVQVAVDIAAGADVLHEVRPLRTQRQPDVGKHSLGLGLVMNGIELGDQVIGGFIPERCGIERLEPGVGDLPPLGFLRCFGDALLGNIDAVKPALGEALRQRHRHPRSVPASRRDDHHHRQELSPAQPR